MATDEKKSGGAKLSRTETVTIRLDPKMRYLAELGSRIHRRTLSSYIEWAINASFGQVSLPAYPEYTIADHAEALWDIDEADRFAYLAQFHPNLLNHEEQRLWKLIRENGYLWRGRYSPEWTWDTTADKLQINRLREHWATFVAVSKNEEPASKLPTWAKTKRTPPPATLSEAKKHADNFDDFPGALQDEDDDLPF